MSDVLQIGQRSLAVFIDETGSEDYGDPAFPVFGYGGCAVSGADYDKVLAEPWKRLKAERLGLGERSFHATVFQKSRPTPSQIEAINSFAKNPYFRFAAVTSIDTLRPEDINAHRATSFATILRIKRIIARCDIDSVDLVFEDTEQNRQLIARDFNPSFLDTLSIRNARTGSVGFNGYFLSKSSCTPGLEVADLVVHTAGRQERLWRTQAARRRFQPDFLALFHGVNEEYVEYISVDSLARRPNQ